MDFFFRWEKSESVHLNFNRDLERTPNWHLKRNRRSTALNFSQTICKGRVKFRFQSKANWSKLISFYSRKIISHLTALNCSYTNFKFILISTLTYYCGFIISVLTHSWRMFLSYRNQSIHLLADQWTGLYMIGTFSMEELNLLLNPHFPFIQLPSKQMGTLKRQRLTKKCKNDLISKSILSKELYLEWSASSHSKTNGKGIFRTPWNI